MLVILCVVLFGATNNAVTQTSVTNEKSLENSTHHKNFNLSIIQKNLYLKIKEYRRLNLNKKYTENDQSDDRSRKIQNVEKVHNEQAISNVESVSHEYSGEEKNYIQSDDGVDVIHSKRDIRDGYIDRTLPVFGTDMEDSSPSTPSGRNWNENIYETIDDEHSVVPTTSLPEDELGNSMKMYIVSANTINNNNVVHDDDTTKIFNMESKGEYFEHVDKGNLYENHNTEPLNTKVEHMNEGNRVSDMNVNVLTLIDPLQTGFTNNKKVNDVKRMNGLKDWMWHTSTMPTTEMTVPPLYLSAKITSTHTSVTVGKEDQASLSQHTTETSVIDSDLPNEARKGLMEGKSEEDILRTSKENTETIIEEISDDYKDHYSTELQEFQPKTTLTKAVQVEENISSTENLISFLFKAASTVTSNHDDIFITSLNSEPTKHPKHHKKKYLNYQQPFSFNTLLKKAKVPEIIIEDLENKQAEEGKNYKFPESMEEAAITNRGKNLTEQLQEHKHNIIDTSLRKMTTTIRRTDATKKDKSIPAESSSRLAQHNIQNKVNNTYDLKGKLQIIQKKVLNNQKAIENLSQVFEKHTQTTTESLKIEVKNVNQGRMLTKGQDNKNSTHYYQNFTNLTNSKKSNSFVITQQPWYLTKSNNLTPQKSKLETSFAVTALPIYDVDKFWKAELKNLIPTDATPNFIDTGYVKPLSRKAGEEFEHETSNVTQTSDKTPNTLTKGIGIVGGSIGNDFDDHDEYFENEPIYREDQIDFRASKNKVPGESAGNKTKVISSATMMIPLKRVNTKLVTKKIMNKLLKLKPISLNGEYNIFKREFYLKKTLSLYKTLVQITLYVLENEMPMIINKMWYDIVKNNETIENDSSDDITTYYDDIAHITLSQSNLGESNNQRKFDSNKEDITSENTPVFSDNEMYEYNQITKAKSLVETILDIMLNENSNETINKVTGKHLKTKSPIYIRLVNTIINIFNNYTLSAVNGTLGKKNHSYKATAPYDDMLSRKSFQNKKITLNSTINNTNTETTPIQAQLNFKRETIKPDLDNRPSFGSVGGKPDFYEQTQAKVVPIIVPITKYLDKSTTEYDINKERERNINKEWVSVVNDMSSVDVKALDTKEKIPNTDILTVSNALSDITSAAGTGENSVLPILENIEDKLLLSESNVGSETSLATQNTPVTATDVPTAAALPPLSVSVIDKKENRIGNDTIFENNEPLTTKSSKTLPKEALIEIPNINKEVDLYDDHLLKYINKYSKEATSKPLSRMKNKLYEDNNTFLDVDPEDLEKMLYYEMPIQKPEGVRNISNSSTTYLTDKAMNEILKEIHEMYKLSHDIESINVVMNETLKNPMKLNPNNPNIAKELGKLLLKAEFDKTEKSKKIPGLKISSADEENNQIHPTKTHIAIPNNGPSLHKMLLQHKIKTLQEHTTSEKPTTNYWKDILRTVYKEKEPQSCPPTICFFMKPEESKIGIPKNVSYVTFYFNNTESKEKNKAGNIHLDTSLNAVQNQSNIPKGTLQTNSNLFSPPKSFFYDSPAVQTFSSNCSKIILKIDENIHKDMPICGLENGACREIEEGKDNIEKYPWLGMLLSEELVTTVVLVTFQIVIASASEIDRLPKEDFRSCTKVILGQNCSGPHFTVLNYQYHPDFRAGFLSSLAMIQIDTANLIHKLRPICPPPRTFASVQFYTMVLPNDCTNSKIKIYKMDYVPMQSCRQYYRRLGSNTSLWPRHSACGKARWGGACLWQAGAVLVIKQDHRWHLLGFGVPGPGCEVPSRYIDYSMYTQWLALAVARIGHPSVTKVTPNRLIFRRGVDQIQRFGPCDEEEISSHLFNGSAEQQQPIWSKRDGLPSKVHYNLTIRNDVDYQCVVLEANNINKLELLPQPKLDIRRNRVPRSGNGSIPFNVTIEYYDDIRYMVLAYGRKSEKNHSLLVNNDDLKISNNINEHKCHKLCKKNHKNKNVDDIDISSTENNAIRDINKANDMIEVNNRVKSIEKANDISSWYTEDNAIHDIGKADDMNKENSAITDIKEAKGIDDWYVASNIIDGKVKPSDDGNRVANDIDHILWNLPNVDIKNTANNLDNIGNKILVNNANDNWKKVMNYNNIKRISNTDDNIEKRENNVDNDKNSDIDKSKVTWDANGRRYISRTSLEKFKNSYSSFFFNKRAFRRKDLATNRRRMKGRGRRRTEEDERSDFIFSTSTEAN